MREKVEGHMVIFGCVYRREKSDAVKIFLWGGVLNFSTEDANTGDQAEIESAFLLLLFVARMEVRILEFRSCENQLQRLRCLFVFRFSA